MPPEILRKYGLILGVELEYNGGVEDMSCKASSYVANGVVNCEWALESGEGDPGSDDPEPPRLCNLACLFTFFFVGW